MEYIKIGFIKKPHGVRGELKVLPLTDVAGRFKKIKKIYFERETGFRSAELVSVKIASDEVIIKLAECSSKDDAEKYRNLYVWIERADAVALDEWEFYSQDVIGLDVYFQDKKIGKIVDLLNSGANDNIEISLEDGKSFYYPFIRTFIDEVDVNNGLIRINQFEGFFE